jgi:hypothetical protein
VDSPYVGVGRCQRGEGGEGEDRRKLHFEWRWFVKTG